ncbi:TrmH family RNA methyltransferase [Clostridium polynesiense]|uniref:TrmH family RNA methyltransferase n=1 Tax=Clostridium polynesiense TaxID=1325933 RepID=UPI0005911FE1|nr:RNA methyltransferase [Clostridium polynesiense]
MIIIESKDNKVFKDIKKLKSKRYRYEKKLYIIEGYRFVEEAIKSGAEIESLLYTSSFMEKHDEEMQQLLSGNYSSQYILKDSLFKDICDTENPQGIIATVKFKFPQPEIKRGIFVLVDRIQDPGNLGTIIRTADAVGALGVICTKGTVDFLNEKVLRSTMGSIFRVPIITEKENLNFSASLKSQGFKFIGTYLKAEKSIYDLDLSEETVFCIGNEASGLSDEILNFCHEKAIIPMVGNAESLNASIAASVVMFEALRQRLKKQP